MNRLSDVEIIDRYEAAIDKEEVIDKLAVACRTDRTGMRAKLRELGMDVEEPPPLEDFKVVSPPGRKKSAPLDELRAMELFKEGMDDLAMAETLGVSEKKIKEWRSRMHLERPKGRKKRLEECGECDISERAAERMLQESPLEPPAPVRTRPAGNIRMEPRLEKAAQETVPKGWTVNDFSMAHRCLGVIEGIAEGITLNPGARALLLKSARTLCELLEKNRP